jgi:hypothetical protein
MGTTEKIRNEIHVKETNKEEEQKTTRKGIE